MKAENFYSTFLAYYGSIKKLERQDFAEKIDSTRPFVFAMVNDAVYQENRAAFEERDYELITEENAAWYKLASYSLGGGAVGEAVEEAGGQAAFSPAAYSSYYIENIKSLSSTKLSNGIPLVVKSNPGSKTVLTSIAIAGGEGASPKGKHFLRTVLINAFASCIQDEMAKMRDGGLLSGDVKISAWTTEVTSYITMECMASELERALTALVNAIVYGDIRPLSADKLISSQNYQTRLKTDSLSWQLKSSAIRELYKDSPYAEIFNIAETEELRETAGAIFGAEPIPELRCRLAASVLDKLWGYYTHLEDRSYYDAYRQRSVVLGRPINILAPDRAPQPAVTVDIDPDFALLVRTEDGNALRLNTGEVSIRMKE